MAGGQLRLRVTLDEAEPFTVETRLIDHNNWDVTRTRHKWPTASDAPLTWLGFIAWSAARRTGNIGPEITWDIFLTRCLGVDNLDNDDDEAGTADPTRRDLGPA